MKNAVALIVVIAVAIGLGVAISVQMTNSPSTSPFVGQQLATVIDRQARIDQRLSKIEEQQTKMLEIFDGAKKAAERYAQQPPQPAAAAPQAAAQMPPQEDLNRIYEIPIDQSPVRGKKDAPIIIVKFTDFQCPFCQRFYPPILDVLKAYPNDVKFVLKNFPLSFHPNAKPAAKSALAAGEQGKYWEMVDILLQPGQSLAEEDFKAAAKKIGLNVDKFMKDYKDKDVQWEAILQKDMDLGTRVDVMGTPTFYINGKKTMARDLNGFKTEIEQILKKK